MMPRDINDQPGDLPGEGGEKVPRAVRYLLDGYGKEHIIKWMDEDPPQVVMSPAAWQTAVNDAAEVGEVRLFSFGSALPEYVTVGACIRVGDDLDAVDVVTGFRADGKAKITVNL